MSVEPLHGNKRDTFLNYIEHLCYSELVKVARVVANIKKRVNDKIDGISWTESDESSTLDLTNVQIRSLDNLSLSDSGITSLNLTGNQALEEIDLNDLPKSLKKIILRGTGLEQFEERINKRLAVKVTDKSISSQTFRRDKQYEGDRNCARENLTEAQDNERELLGGVGPIHTILKQLKLQVFEEKKGGSFRFS